MGRPEAFPGLFENMEKYSLSVDTIRSYIQDYWDQGGADFDDFMERLPVNFEGDDVKWGRRVFSGQWSAMSYEDMYG